jgi:hypothetical protein
MLLACACSSLPSTPTAKPTEEAKADEAGQRQNGGDSGPDSWQFWGPNRQLLNAGE